MSDESFFRFLYHLTVRGDGANEMIHIRSSHQVSPSSGYRLRGSGVKFLLIRYRVRTKTVGFITKEIRDNFIQNESPKGVALRYRLEPISAEGQTRSQFNRRRKN